MNKAVAILRLTRIEHSLMLVVAVLAAELIAKGLPGTATLLLGLATAVLINMGAFAINDYFDIEADRANRKKNRPLVNKSLKPNEAVYITAFTMLTGVLASSLINIPAFLIACAFALLSVLYAYRLKEVLFLGNAYVALSMAIPFIFGAYVVGSFNTAIALVSVMVFISGLAREIHGTIRDLKGDVRTRNARTVPRTIGIAAAAYFAFAFYLIAIGISVYLAAYVTPFAHNRVFVLPIGASDVMLIYVGLGYVRHRSASFYRKSRNVSLAAMFLALLALLASPLITSSF